MATLHFSTLPCCSARRIGVLFSALALATAPNRAAAQQVNACYVPSVGAVYLIGLPGSPPTCLAPGHMPVMLRDSALADGSVITIKLASGAVTIAKLSFDPATQAELDALGAPGTINATNNPVEWTRLKGVPAGFADGTDNVGGAGGSVTSITVGAGLVATPDPITTTGTVSVSFAGPGSATSVARSDHTHPVPIESDPTWDGSIDATGDIGRDGNVGIGTTTPTVRLHVVGGTIEAQPASDGSAQFRARSFDGSQNSVLNMRNDGTLSITGASLLKLRTTFGVQVRDVSDANWRDISAASFIVASSRDVKQDISPVDSQRLLWWAGRLRELRPVTYQLRGEERVRSRLGFIAQELPDELRSTDGEGVDLYALTTAIAAALQGLSSGWAEDSVYYRSRFAEQASQITHQAEEIRSLQGRVATLETLLERLLRSTPPGR